MKARPLKKRLENNETYYVGKYIGANTIWKIVGGLGACWCTVTNSWNEPWLDAANLDCHSRKKLSFKEAKEIVPNIKP